jgi:predicted Ser/Thr protein kinase
VQPDACPSAEQWGRISRWDLASAESDRFAEHVEQCSACAGRIENLARQHQVVGALRSGVADAILDQSEIEAVVHRLARLADPAATWSRASDNTESSQHRPETVAPLHARLGEFRVLEVLGRGGMGVVYKAFDENTKRFAAVKVLRVDDSDNEKEAEKARRRFLREAQMLAAVKSQHVVSIYQFGQQDGTPFLAMEFLEGQTLEAWLRTRAEPITETELLWVAKHVLSGLAKAHEKGIVHRDLKPANLVVERDTLRVILIDFGLTCGPEQGDAISSSGTIVGTPAYMSPEQARGEPAGPASDLFSLGAVLYRMATGKSPFQRENVMATLGALANTEAPPLKHLSPEVAGFVGRLMAKRPDQRPRSAVVALADVAALERSLRQAATLPLQRPRRPAGKGLLVACGLIGLVLLVAAGLIIYLYDSNRRIVGIVAIPGDSKNGGVDKVVIVDTKTGDKTTIPVGPKSKEEVKPPPAAIVGPIEKGSLIVMTANTQGFQDSSSGAEHFVVDQVEIGAKGTVVALAAGDSNRCCVRLESHPKEEVWVSLEFVRRR